MLECRNKKREQLVNFTRYIGDLEELNYVKGLISFVVSLESSNNHIRMNIQFKKYLRGDTFSKYKRLKINF